MRNLLTFLVALFLLPEVVLNAGEVKLAGIFRDQAVLQRDRPVPIWGQADPGDAVTVEFAGQKKTATADKTGKWLVMLDAMPACARPRDLHVGGKVIRQVLVGEVWLIAGGSEVGKRATDLEPSADVRVFEISPATAREVQNQVKGRWSTVAASDLKTLPAEAVLLGQNLARELGVPVGMISASIGYPAESWMSREMLAATPAAEPILAFYKSNLWKMRTVGTYEERLKAWTEYCQKLPLNPPPRPTPSDGDKLAKQEPAGVWNAMIAPLVPLALGGIVWDNGEDWASQNRAYQQGQLLPPMIAGWRQAFGELALPFVIVQLRPHRHAVPFGVDGRLAAELRDAQREAAGASKAKLVVTIDLGADPSPRKVASRIAQAILGKTGGPQLAGTETQGDKVHLRFTNPQGGLTAKGGELKGFAVASSMFRWVWAEVKIDGDKVVVSAPTVPHPQGVRYGYEDLPAQGANLYDGTGNPAAPFRTDDHVSLTGKNLDPSAEVLRFDPRKDLGVEDARLPRVLIIGDSISGHYLAGVRERMRGKANVIGEASMRKGTWASMGPNFYRADWAAKGEGLKNFLAERGPFAIVHFNNGIHNFARANPGDEKPYAEQLRQVVATIRASGAVCLFANSTGTIGDNVIPTAPRYLTNCRAFNAAAEKVMRELNVPVTDIHGLIQPRIKELISSDLIHTNKEADEMMADLIARRLTETIATLPQAQPAKPATSPETNNDGKGGIESSLPTQHLWISTGAQSSTAKEPSSDPVTTANHIFWASEPVRPDEAVMLIGDDLQNVNTIEIRRLSEESSPAEGKKSETTEQTVKPIQATAQSLKFILPAILKLGVYECVIKSAGWSQTLRLNAPSVWWMQGDGGTFATPGGWLRIFGKSLSLGEPGAVKLLSRDGKLVTLEAPAGDGFGMSLALPATLATGSYRVAVRNGKDSPWSEAGSFEVKPVEVWPEQVFNVMDFYGADAEKEILRTFGNYRQPLDRTAAIEAALKKAADNGGGIVYFPEGKYVFEGELKVPPRTILKGAGMGLTVLRFGKGGFALDGGNSERRLEDEIKGVPPRLLSGENYRVQDMSLYVPRHFKAGIVAGDNFQMHKVRVRVDRFWIREGKRENETLLRMGGNSRVTDCDLLAQGLAIAYHGPGVWITRNKIMAGKANLALERSDGAIIEDNQFISVDPQAYINLNGEGRNMYYARNQHVSQFVHQSDFSFTFDGTGGAYLGKVAAVKGTALALAEDPTYPDWAKEKHPLWRRSVVAVLSGKGAGQYRHVTANQGRQWQVDRPWDVTPDVSSTISIIPYRGRLLVIGNRFEDANWVNLGYGSSFDVICAQNQLYRVGSFLNYGLRLKGSVQPSWFVQYFDNDVHEGNTLVVSGGDLRNPQLFGGSVTRGCVHRGTHVQADNSGNISIGGNAEDVIVERCTLDHPRSQIRVEKQASGVLLRNNNFSGGNARYTGDRLGAAVVLPTSPGNK